MTEYSVTSSLAPIRHAKDNITRCASMPGVEKRMEKTVFEVDYNEIAHYASSLENMLNNAGGAEVTFSTGDYLRIDLRNLVAESESGDCSRPGQFINLPSGEAWKAPYEATFKEICKFGESKTKGTLPVSYDEELVKYIIKNNRIVDIIGNGKKQKKCKYFLQKTIPAGTLLSWASAVIQKQLLQVMSLKMKKLDYILRME